MTGELISRSLNMRWNCSTKRLSWISGSPLSFFCATMTFPLLTNDSTTNFASSIGDGATQDDWSCEKLESLNMMPLETTTDLTFRIFLKWTQRNTLNKIDDDTIQCKLITQPHFTPHFTPARDNKNETWLSLMWEIQNNQRQQCSLLRKNKWWNRVRSTMRLCNVTDVRQCYGRVVALYQKKIRNY